MKDLVVARLASGGATKEMIKGPPAYRNGTVGTAGVFICMSLLTGCASDAGYPAPQGFQTCDRNGGQEERKACLP